MADDLDALQGNWNLTSFEVDGKKMAADGFAGSRVVIKGSRFTSLGMGATYEGTLEVDPARTPKTVDMTLTRGHAAGTRHLGIYTVDGDRWTICLAMHGDTRPRRFGTRAGTGVALETFQRGPAPRARATPKPTAAPKGRSTVPAAAGATELEGEWVMTAGVMNGAAMGPDMVKWCQRITRGSVTSVVAGPQTMLKASFTLDRAATPGAIDYVNLEGANKGKTQAGIFEVKDGTLRICMAAPGRPRPGDFSSSKGDGRSFTSWRLVQP